VLSAKYTDADIDDDDNNDDDDEHPAILNIF
jgi:hypothetical protein